MVTWGSMNGPEANGNVAFEQSCYEQAKAEVAAEISSTADESTAALSAFEVLRLILSRAQQIKLARRAAKQ